MHLVADDVWQLEGFPRHAVNVYLMHDVVIDAATRWGRRRVFRQLRKRKVSLVALTHCHPDHQGVAKALCSFFDVPLACHEADVPAMEGREPMYPHNWLIPIGVRIMGGPPYRVGRVLREGDDVAGFRVVHAPGHTPGHIIYFRESDRLAIAGDVLANMNFRTLKPGLQQPPPFFCVDAVQNRHSILKLAELKPRMVCFGHGPPLREPELLEKYAERIRHYLREGRRPN